MDYSSVQKYQKNHEGFPEDCINPAEKDMAWHAQFCKAMYSEFLRDQCVVPFSTRENLKEFRAYGAGRQSPDRYRDKFFTVSDKKEHDYTRKGFSNIDWSVVPIFQKYKSVIKGMFETIEHNVIANATDPISGDEKFDKMWFQYFRKQLNKWLRPLEEATGMTIPEATDEQEEYVPDSMQEMGMWEQLGSFKLKFEVAIERIANYTFNEEADWVAVKRKLVDDIIDIGLFGTKVYVDQISQKLKVRYSDPQFIIAQNSKHHDFRDTKYFGEPYLVQLNDIIALDVFEEKQIESIIESNRGINKNSDDFHLSSYQGDTRNMDFKVLVLDGEYKTIDRKYKLKRINSRGEERVFDAKWGEEIDTPKRKTVKEDTRVIRKCKWIIGTDLAYDYGLQNDVPRAKNSEPLFSFQFYQIPGQSMVEQCIPFIDQFNLAWFKFQNALSKMRPAGISVEWGALNNMSVGGKSMGPKDVLAIYRETGDLVYKASTHGGQFYGNGAKPFQELQGGMGNQLNEFITMFELFQKQIGDVTGITPQASATEPRVEQGLGVSEIAIQATANALKPYFSAYNELKERTAENVGLRAQILLGFSKKAREYYHPIIGLSAVEVLKISKEISLRELGISLKLKPQEADKQRVEQAALQAMNVGRDGKPTINLADYLMIIRMLDSGDVKMAEAQLGHLINKRAKEADQKQQENIQLQNQGQQKTIQMQAQADQQKLTQETNAKIKIQTNKYQWEYKIAQLNIQGKGAEKQMDIAADFAKKELEKEDTAPGTTNNA